MGFMVDCDMPRREFTLTGLDEGYVRKSKTNNNLRLVCRTAEDGKLAIWGGPGDRRNIDAVLAAGLPCTVECETAPVDSRFEQYGHTAWVPQGAYLRVVASERLPLEPQPEGRSMRIETQSDDASGSMRFVARALEDGRRICEVGEYGGPPTPIESIQGKLAAKVAAWVLAEQGVVVDHYWVRRFQGSEPTWDRRPLSKEAIQKAIADAIETYSEWTTWPSSD